MNKNPGNNGISWLSHPQKLFTVKHKNTGSFSRENIQKEANESFMEVVNEEIESITKERTYGKEDADNKEPDEVVTSAATKKKRSRKRQKVICNNVDNRNQLPIGVHENHDKIINDECATQHEEANGLKNDMKDTLINKLKSNTELFETVEKLTNVFDATGYSGKQKKKILHDLVTYVTEISDTRGTEMVGSLTAQFKGMWDIRMIKQTYANTSQMETHHFLDGGMSSFIHFGYCLKNGIKQEVAIKKPKFGYDEMVAAEAEKLAQFDHKNVIKLIGVSFDKLEIALEYMTLGSLVSALRIQPFSDLNLLKVIRDVATGMEYIHAKDYIHADLACRNIFVNEHKQCKIGDFGNCVYVGYTNGEHITKKCDPFTFLRCENVAPEVSTFYRFDKASDVWAMGILIYDLYERAHGDPPVMLRFMKILGFKSQTKRLEKPTRCPKNIWIFITEKMINRNKNRRTTFSDLREKCDQMLEGKKNDF